MKKFLASVLSAVMICTMVGCGSGSATDSQTSSADLDNNAATDTAKVYTIGTDTTFAPFEFQDSTGKYVGIDMELLEAVAEDQGFQYQVNALGFDAAVQALEAQQVDGVIAGMSITDKRKESFDFSEPYFDSGVVMGIAESDDSIKSYDDLAGKKVAAKQGTEGLEFAQANKDKYGYELVVFEDSATMYEDVKLGNTVACFEDYPVLGYAITQGIGLKMVTEKEQGSSYGFAVPKGKNAELLEMFNNGLANLQANGKYQEILDKYIQE